MATELYHPELTSTGYFLTGIAEALAEDYEVRVLTSQPTYAARGTIAPSTERHRGVSIRRVRSTRFDKDNLPLRAVNNLTFCAAVGLAALTGFRKGDVVLAVTSPPLLPYVVQLVATLRGARVALLVYDVYPDVLVATGHLEAGSLPARIGNVLSRWLYARADRIIAPGRDVRTSIVRRDANSAEKITVISNWGDTEQVRGGDNEGAGLRAQLGLDGKFIVGFLGNMGRTHGLDALIETAERLRHERRIHFVFTGWGAKREMLAGRVAQGLDNVTLLPPAPAETLSAHLGLADLAVIAYVPGMAGVSVPSRLYNVLASGRPVLAISDPGSELWQVVAEEGVGWNVDARAGSEEIAKTVLAASLIDGKVEKGLRARRAAETRYSRPVVLARFREFFVRMGQE